ncbi:MAG: ATP-binding protein [Rothia sp. (in: high G+C Gram-positive bacteria)]|nr:ATP-binding protein [Rothia sp. (in: high G+C Gram-positive bacteria)]
MSQRFKVDLGGLVELLSKNLYSGPQVYLREVLQNGVDAITARAALEPNAPAQVRLDPWENGEGITITDTGIGLTAAQAEEFLATIGRTSKRDEVFGEGRAEYLGQFGIGLLACFLIADTVDITSQSALAGEPPVRWLGRADGTFEVQPVAEGDLPVGTVISLKARQDAAHWVAEETVVTLASDYGDMLPLDVAVRVSAGGQRLWRRVSRPMLPWAGAVAALGAADISDKSGQDGGAHLPVTQADELGAASSLEEPKTPQPNAHEAAMALTNYAESALGFTPLAAIPLSVPATGTTGVAYVLPQAVSPGSGRHRVYVKNMLVNSREDTLLPDWAFFVRAVLNSESLTPTASREQLREDEILLLTREAIGQQLKTWITQTLSEPSAAQARFIETHHLALRAVALASDDMLDVVAAALPFETTQGFTTLAEVASESGQVRFTPTTEAYRRIAPVARAQGLWVVNGGYVYDSDILAKLANRPGWEVTELTAKDVTQTLETVGLDREFEVLDALERAKAVLAEHDCDVRLRSFEPADVPAVLLRDAEAERRRAIAQESEAAGDVWGGLLGSFTADETAEPTRTLVLNDTNDSARRLLAQPHHASFEPGVQTLYLSALMLAGEGLGQRETWLLSDSLSQLLAAALRAEN